jgi:glycosyltransferase involved in cell wall biosynthesis
LIKIIKIGIIIVNDGSIDGRNCFKMGGRDRFRYFSKENEGLGKARNYGIERKEFTFYH